MGKLSNMFMSSVRRYGIKYRVGDHVFSTIGTVIALGSAFGALYYDHQQDTLHSAFYCALALTGVIVVLYVQIDTLERRIRELGADILHPGNSKK